MPKYSPVLENNRILIIDDQESIHQDFRKILKVKAEEDSQLVDMELQLFGGEKKEKEACADYQIHSALQGEQAIDLVKQSLTDSAPYAMAFVDVRMPPGMDGIETIHQFWKIDPNIQVVICTAFSDYSWDETIEKLGQSDQLLVLKKPFDMIEVMQLASSLTAKWNLARQADRNQQQLEALVGLRTKALNKKNIALEKSLKELDEARVQLFQADKLASIGQLAAGLAHEINNPIGYISCNLSTLKKYLTDLDPLLRMHLNDDSKDILKKLDPVLTVDELKYMIEDIEDIMSDSMEGVDRVSYIVKDLTEFSHVNSSDMVPVNVNELMEKTVSVAWNQLKHKVEITRELSEVPIIHANGGQIGQVMLNLVVNSSQAIEGFGRITVRSSSDTENVYFEVEDNGAGIDPKNLSKLFDPFFTTKPVGEGTGLGLHIVHSIISQHQGSIDCSSKVGEGSCFKIALPINTAH